MSTFALYYGTFIVIGYIYPAATTLVEHGSCWAFLALYMTISKAIFREIARRQAAKRGMAHTAVHHFA